MATSDTHAVRLGRALREIRTSLLTDRGTPSTQSDVARRIYVGGKGAISLFESGKRVPSADVVRRYCALTQEDPTALLDLRERAVEENRADATPDDVPVSTQLDVPSGSAPAPTRRVLLLGLGAGAVGLGVAYTTARLITGRGGPVQEPIAITTPHRSAARTVPVRGVIHGWQSHDLWIDVQGPGEPRHHPTDQPCRRVGNSFAYDSLYVGTPRDRGRKFRISLLAAAQESSADAALREYGHRPANTPDTYVGLPTLPAGTMTLASVVVRRL